MHFSSEEMPSDVIASVEGFIEGKETVVRIDSSEIELKAGKFSDQTQIMMLKSTN